MDREITAFSHLVETSILREKLEGRLTPTGRVADWEKTFEDSRSWSDGEQTLLAVAWNLWNGISVEINVRRDIIEGLDDDNFRSVMEAFMILRGIDVLMLGSGVA